MVFSLRGMSEIRFLYDIRREVSLGGFYVKEYQVLTFIRWAAAGTSSGVRTDVSKTSSSMAELLNHHAQQGWEPKHIFDWSGYLWIILERDGYDNG
jgi:hypothetical protein